MLHISAKRDPLADTLPTGGRRYCPHTAHFPRSEVGTVLSLDCAQNIARAVCGEEKIWLVERCSYSKGDAKGREAATKGIESDVMTPCSTLSVSYILSTELIADAECC